MRRLQAPCVPRPSLSQWRRPCWGSTPFAILYIADLNAIGGGTGHLEVVERLHRQHQRVSLWIDRGLTGIGRLMRVARPVIGSESVADLDQWTNLKARLGAPVLSLDY